MRKKIFIISIVIVVIFAIFAAVFYLINKNAQKPEEIIETIFFIDRTREL